MYPTRRIKQPSNVTMQDLRFLTTVGLQKNVVWTGKKIRTYYWTTRQTIKKEYADGVNSSFYISPPTIGLENRPVFIKCLGVSYLNQGGVTLIYNSMYYNENTIIITQGLPDYNTNIITLYGEGTVIVNINGTYHTYTNPDDLEVDLGDNYRTATISGKVTKLQLNTKNFTEIQGTSTSLTELDLSSAIDTTAVTTYFPNLSILNLDGNIGTYILNLWNNAPLQVLSCNDFKGKINSIYIRAVILSVVDSIVSLIKNNNLLENGSIYISQYDKYYTTILNAIEEYRPKWQVIYL